MSYYISHCRELSPQQSGAELQRLAQLYYASAAVNDSLDPFDSSTNFVHKDFKTKIGYSDDGLSVEVSRTDGVPIEVPVSGNISFISEKILVNLEGGRLLYPTSEDLDVNDNIADVLGGFLLTVLPQAYEGLAESDLLNSFRMDDGLGPLANHRAALTSIVEYGLNDENTWKRIGSFVQNDLFSDAGTEVYTTAAVLSGCWPEGYVDQFTVLALLKTKYHLRDNECETYLSIVNASTEINTFDGQVEHAAGFMFIIDGKIVEVDELKLVVEPMSLKVEVDGMLYNAPPELEAQLNNFLATAQTEDKKN